MSRILLPFHIIFFFNVLQIVDLHSTFCMEVIISSYNRRDGVGAFVAKKNLIRLAGSTELDAISISILVLLCYVFCTPYPFVMVGRSITRRIGPMSLQ